MTTNNNDIRNTIMKLRQQGQGAAEIAASLTKQGFTAPGGGELRNYVNYVVYNKARKVGTSTRARPRAEASSPSTTRYRMKNQSEQQGNWSTQSGNSFAVDVLGRNDLNDAQKVRLLNAFFGNENSID